MAEMRLLEKLLVNNPLYAWLQRREVANLHRPAPLSAGLTIMDLSYGRGVARKAA
ncbi:MAG: hypothetical protein V3S20_04460 [Dehalococcoidia bacterium]